MHRKAEKSREKAAKKLEKENVLKPSNGGPKSSVSTKKEVSETIKTLESEIRVKMEAALVDARHSVMENPES